MLLLILLLSSLVATKLVIGWIYILVVLTFLVRVTQFNTFVRTIVVLVSAGIQIDQNMSAVVSPMLRKASLAHLLLGSNHFSYGLDHIGYTNLRCSIKNGRTRREIWENGIRVNRLQMDVNLHRFTVLNRTIYFITFNSWSTIWIQYIF